MSTSRAATTAAALQILAAAGQVDRKYLNQKEALLGAKLLQHFIPFCVKDNYTITGHVPALLNGERVNLILVFDNENPYGYIAGARTDYVEGETETVAKGMSQLQVGDTLDFLCDYYSYSGEYMDSYYLGEQMTVTEDMTISNVDVGEGAVRVTYRFTDIYNQQYWTPAIHQ